MNLKTEIYNVVLNHAIETGNCKQIIEAPFENMVDGLVKLCNLHIVTNPVKIID